MTFQDIWTCIRTSLCWISAATQELQILRFQAALDVHGLWPTPDNDKLRTLQSPILLGTELKLLQRVSHSFLPSQLSTSFRQANLEFL